MADTASIVVEVETKSESELYADLIESYTFRPSKLI